MFRLCMFAIVAASCDAFVVRPAPAAVAVRAAVTPTSAVAPMMGAKAPIKKAKVAKKVAKKPVKKVKKVAKKVAKKAGFKGPAAAQPSPVQSLLSAPGQFFSAENWGVQAVTLLGDGENVPSARSPS